MGKIIITADWHLRSNRPRCRLDPNWIETQKNALNQIAKYARENEADVFVIGDIFHSTNETTNEVIGLVQELAGQLFEECGKSLYILAGNHDLPQHNLDNIYRSAFNILINTKNIFHIRDYDGFVEFGYKHSAGDFGEQDENLQIIFKHVLCFPETAKIPPSDKIVKPSELFAQFDNAKYIFTGDYHRQFIYEGKKKKTQTLLNPGCLLRQAADTIAYVTSVFLVEFQNQNKELKYTSLPIVDNEEMVTDEYIENEVMRNSRIEAFIERIKENEHVTFDFITNVHNLMNSNDIEKNVKDAILELLENT